MDGKECNKFQGLRYYAISKNLKIISEGPTPDDVYFNAVSKGETTPIIISSNTIIKTNEKIY